MSHYIAPAKPLCIPVGIVKPRKTGSSKQYIHKHGQQSLPIPNQLLRNAGVYDVKSSCDNTDEWWLNIEVFVDKGTLRFINPNNNKLAAVKGMHGWIFRWRKKLSGQ